MAPLYQQSDAVSPWYWNSYTYNFSTIWTMQLPITTRKIIPVLARHCAVAVWPSGGHPTETDRRRRPRQTGGVVLSFWWRHWSEILRRIPTVRTAGTLRLRCVFCNSMQYSAACDIFIVENTQSYGTSWFSVKVTAVTLVSSMVLDIGMSLGL